MKNFAIIAGLCLVAIGTISALNQRDADANPPATATLKATTQAPTTVPSVGGDAEMFAKKCSFSSDCPYGKCGKGTCGACSFTSDCKGWGKCDKGRCGACSFSSECKGFGGCSSGRCKKSPY